MEIRSSLRNKSILALSLYLCFFLAIIGSVTYFVVEPLVRSKIEQNLDLRTELLAAQIEGPLNSSLGLLDSLVGFAQGNPPPSQLSRGIANIIAASGNIVSSGGLWPEPELNQAKPIYRSLFFNKTKQGGVDQVNATRLRASGMFIRISSWPLQYRSGIGFSVSFFWKNKPFPAIPEYL